MHHKRFFLRPLSPSDLLRAEFFLEYLILRLLAGGHVLEGGDVEGHHVLQDTAPNLVGPKYKQIHLFVPCTGICNELNNFQHTNLTLILG